VAKVVKNGEKTTRERDESAWESGERWKRERESCLLNVDQQAWRGWWDHRSVQSLNSLVSHSPSSSHFLKCLSKSSSANLWSMALHPIPSPRPRRRPRAYTSTATPLDPLHVQPIHAQPARIPPPRSNHWLPALVKGRS
jgi:hypothetical protein